MGIQMSQGVKWGVRGVPGVKESPSFQFQFSKIYFQDKENGVAE